MKCNALSLANYFVTISLDTKEELRPLKLMKLVYIAYGYALALLDRCIIDPRFDKVEAWKLGPVIPSVYHSFKMFGSKPITAQTCVLVGTTDSNAEFQTPTLQDDKVKMLCDFVWKSYALRYDGNELVTLLHGVGTPWGKVYEEGKNNPIPEMLTKAYYKELVRRMRNGN